MPSDPKMLVRSLGFGDVVDGLGAEELEREDEEVVDFGWEVCWELEEVDAELVDLEGVLTSEVRVAAAVACFFSSRRSQ